MVDRAVLAEKIAAVRDAVARIRETMPPSAEELAADRTRREAHPTAASRRCAGLAKKARRSAGRGRGWQRSEDAATGT